MEKLTYSGILNAFPLAQKDDFRTEISSLLKINKIKIIVLDDDPTGIQTVHGCLLITKWDKNTLIEALGDDSPCFYVLTNTRSLAADSTDRINREVVQNILSANKDLNYKLIFISRSDSTLRGHFPLEPASIRSELKKCNTGSTFPTFFIPSFLEAGRYTIRDTQYLKDADLLIPVSETEFARDNVFGYSHSNLIDYIVEKTGNESLRTNIHSISINYLRENTIDSIVKHLQSLKNAVFIIVNALEYCDLQKFSLGLLQIFTRQNFPVVLRTSSSLPKVLSGIDDKSLLNKTDLITQTGFGIFVVGSHVKKTTQQLDKLLLNKNIQGIELDAAEILNNPDRLFFQTLEILGHIVAKGITPVLYTSRKEIRLDDVKARLDLGNRISAFIVKIIQNLPFKPAYLVAKGGITSNDILTQGLKIEKARVMGQILTGVPVITTDNDNHYPNLPYIIFPGNVGDENSLAEVFEKLG
jgi:uncharacterized protein YgbK (DUF1537 family)